ncbi:MAG: GYD domain-containing protein [Halobacteriota archaeon]
MPTHIMLIKWTQAGIEKVKDAPQRIERARNTFKAVCGELKDLYFTFGKYDIVTIAEAPSDEAMGRAALITAGFGAVRIETVKAFPEAEGYEIIKGLP